MAGWTERLDCGSGTTRVHGPDAGHGVAAPPPGVQPGPRSSGPGTPSEGNSAVLDGVGPALRVAEREPATVAGHVIIDLTQGCGSVAPLLAGAVSAGVPARRIASRSASTVLASLASNKMGAVFGAESPWEARAMTLADVLEDVEAFGPQPVEVRWRDGGRVRRAYPDLGVVLLDGRAELWECKHRDFDAALAARLVPLGAALARRGVRYRVRTPRWTAAEPRLSNARQLGIRGSRPLDPEVRAAVARSLPRLRTPVLGALRAAAGVGMAELLCAAARGVFAVCIDGVPLGDGSPVRAPRQDARSGAYLSGES